MMFNCPICGKRVFAHWPEHWVYRRGPTYYCSDQCMDVAIARSTKLLNSVLFKKRKDLIMNNKITLEMKKKAAQIAIDGGNPLPYLKQHGAKNPSATWQYVRKCLEKADPEMYAKLPDRLPKTAGEVMADAKAAADEFFGKCEDMGLLKDKPATVKIDGPIRIETPEGNQVAVIETPEELKAVNKPYKPVVYDNMMAREVEGLFGRYRRTDVGQTVYIDFESKEQLDTISLTVDHWRAFRDEQQKAAGILGVAL